MPSLRVWLLCYAVWLPSILVIWNLATQLPLIRKYCTVLPIQRPTVKFFFLRSEWYATLKWCFIFFLQICGHFFGCSCFRLLRRLLQPSFGHWPQIWLQGTLSLWTLHCLLDWCLAGSSGLHFCLPAFEEFPGSQKIERSLNTSMYLNYFPLVQCIIIWQHYSNKIYYRTIHLIFHVELIDFWHLNTSWKVSRNITKRLRLMVWYFLVICGQWLVRLDTVSCI